MIHRSIQLDTTSDSAINPFQTHPALLSRGTTCVAVIFTHSLCVALRGIKFAQSLPVSGCIETQEPATSLHCHGVIIDQSLAKCSRKNHVV
ncbi:hypothetical protein COMA2_120114 [Candidatus Nitrospira nitrificans]|uniref:Uncharacterized protein n=1 Tax=Candidatus Nitrospira nitrificans TaxID=1742973 RepID=A0A0S4L694_9BACT|nr:hypothetical protein COMA2_120114 [Candidatus Nitrospira nitrificans]